METRSFRPFSLLRLVSLSVLLLGSTQLPAAEDANEAGLETAIFAGGCFWCMEPPYDKLDGVKSTVAGYIGGHVENPTYQAVSGGSTGHAEAVMITYDPKLVDYPRLLEVFWRNIDPLTADRQFCDRGGQYRSAIFYLGEQQRSLAEASKQAISASFEAPVVTELVAAGTFYPAEDYHQDYYQKNPLRYKYYRFSCGRDKRLKEIWGDDDARDS